MNNDEPDMELLEAEHLEMMDLLVAQEHILNALIMTLTESGQVSVPHLLDHIDQARKSLIERKHLQVAERVDEKRVFLAHLLPSKV